MRPAILTDDERAAAATELTGWWVGRTTLHTAYRCPSAAAALELIAGIGVASEQRDHHPELDWRYDHVFLRLTTHQVGDLTARDLDLARRIDELAAGAQARPELVRHVEIGIDTEDPDPLKDVWKAALGYTEDRHGDLVDPWARGPSLWFQESATPAPSRLHVDVHVRPDSAQGVVDDVVAAGARSDATSSPSWWVLTDTDGNRVCVCTPEPPPR